MSEVDMTYNKTSDSSCDMTFKSDVEGIATTYANLYRRVLLQSTPRISVAGICCKVNGNYVKNFFEIIPGLTGSLIDINMALHNAVFDFEGASDKFILTISLTGRTNLSDICDESKCVVHYGDVSSIKLLSQDRLLANVVGNNTITLDIFFMMGTGYSQKDVNTQELSELIGDDQVKNWIVTDSQHRGVANVAYHNEVRLGKQTVTLSVKSHQNDIDSIIDGCTKRIIGQLQEFLM